MGQTNSTSDLNGEGTAKVSWPAKPDALFSVPSSLRSDEDLKWFFSFFPMAAICLLGEPYKRPSIEKRWNEFSFKELKALNEYGAYGVFFTSCNVKTPHHKIEDFKSVCAWYCDIDVTRKDELVSIDEVKNRKSVLAGKILFCNYATSKFLFPSLTIETRNGFHLYWFALDGTQAHFELIQKKIVEYFGGDTKAMKIVQLLRVPGFLNNKTKPGFPVIIRRELSSFISYKEKDFETLYPGLFDVKEKIKPVIKPRGHTLKDIVSHLYSIPVNDIFEKVKNLNQAEALMRLSGTPEVNGEVYELRSVAGGRKFNIKINSKSSSCFIDLEKNCLFVPKESGRGSPNIIEWLKWYRDWDKVELAATLKKYFS